MSEGVFTVNAGSSSIKVALFDQGGDLSAPVFATQVDGIGVDGGALTHDEALSEIVARVRSAAGAMKVTAVGHRIVHGGARFDRPALIDDRIEAEIKALAPLAPLHQPHNLAGVRAARAAFPGMPQVACFDTAFHRTQPPVQQRFAIPQYWHDAGVRRYGFHGLSYESVIAQLAAIEPELARGRVVVAHLGNGASMCAIHEGRSVATTMSFSPLDGLTMGTRCGRLDAAVVLHLIEHHRMDTATVSELLHKQSGLLGLSDLSSDMRTLLASGAQAAQLAIEHFIESALRELAGLAAALRGLDALVFTGGIGENAAVLRERIVEGAKWMGLRLDARANTAGERRIDAEGSAVALRVLRTNEEAVIARHTIEATE